MRRLRGPDSSQDRTRGAVAVEAALLLPIFFLLLFGIIEWALFMRDSLSVTEASRVGVRTASALPREPGFTQLTVNAMQRAGSAVPRSTIDFVLVYKANAAGFPGPNGNTTMTCTGWESTCDRFVWDGTAFVLSPATTPWDYRTVNACPTAASGGPPDNVGVHVQVTHRWLTGFFRSTSRIADRAVLPFEPKQISNCR
jgi:hypothetical protein